MTASLQLTTNPLRGKLRPLRQQLFPLLFFLNVYPIGTAEAQAGNLIGSNEKSVAQVLGDPVPKRADLLDVGGVHKHYRCSVLNNLVFVEAIFLGGKCVGLEIRPDGVVQNLQNDLPFNVANEFLNNCGGLGNWIPLVPDANRDFLHRRFGYTAKYNGQALSIWERGGLVKAAKAEKLPEVGDADEEGEENVLTLPKLRQLLDNLDGRRLELDQFTGLDLDAAAALVAQPGLIVSLDGLTTISPPVAKVLSKGDWMRLTLGGITEIDADSYGALRDGANILLLSNIKVLGDDSF